MFYAAMTILGAVLFGVCFVEVYRIGFKDGAQTQKQEREKLLRHAVTQNDEVKSKVRKEEDKRRDVLLENINNYSGDGMGQKEIL